MLEFLQLFSVHFWFLKRFAKVLHLVVLICYVALFSCSAIKLSTEPTSTNLSDILEIKRRLASFRARDDVACRMITFHWWKTSFVQPEAVNDDFSLVKFHRSRRWLAATKNRTIFSSLSSVWINFGTYKIMWKPMLFTVLKLTEWLTGDASTAISIWKLNMPE